MDVREKLVELKSIITCPNAICNFCEHFKNKDACEKHKKEVIADNMIAHGVTVQEWISVSERLPQNFVSVLGYMTDAGEFPPVRECYTVGNAFSRESYTGETWAKNEEFDKQFSSAKGNSSGCYICVVDLHD